MLVFISCMAYGTATATLVGQNMAAHAYDLAERYAFEAAKIGALIYAVFGLGVALFPEAVLHIWCKDAPVIAEAAPLLRVLALFAPLMCVALVFTYALYGAGNSLFVMRGGRGTLQRAVPDPALVHPGATAGPRAVGRLERDDRLRGADGRHHDVEVLAGRLEAHPDLDLI